MDAVVADIKSRPEGCEPSKVVPTDSFFWDAGGSCFGDWPQMSFVVDGFTVTIFADHYDAFLNRLERSKARALAGKKVHKIHGKWQILAITPAFRQKLLRLVRAQIAEAQRLNDEFMIKFRERMTN